MRKFFPIVMAVLVAAVSCREPSAREDFIAGEGPFVFNVDMSDTTRLYDFSFYTRLDARPHLLETVVDMPLDITWAAPSGLEFGETVFLPLTGNHATFYSRQIHQPYRSGVEPTEAGLWTLTVAKPDTVSIPGFRGLGLVQSHRPR